MHFLRFIVWRAVNLAYLLLELSVDASVFLFAGFHVGISFFVVRKLELAHGFVNPRISF